MKKVFALSLAICCLWLFNGCNRSAQNKSAHSEAAFSSEASSETQAESIADIISKAAVSVEYKLKDGWVVEPIDTAAAKAFIDKLIGAFPEQFGEVAFAYSPEDIIIKISLGENAQHCVDVSSNAVAVKEVTISSIEISHDGVVFLRPQGTSLAGIKNMDAVLAYNAPAK